MLVGVASCWAAIASPEVPFWIRLLATNTVLWVLEALTLCRYRLIANTRMPPAIRAQVNATASVPCRDESIPRRSGVAGFFGLSSISCSLACEDDYARAEAAQVARLIAPAAGVGEIDVFDEMADDLV